jgi:hypothetical protein
LLQVSVPIPLPVTDSCGVWVGNVTANAGFGIGANSIDMAEIVAITVRAIVILFMIAVIESKYLRIPG